MYTGVTNTLLRRVREHKQKKVAGFTKRYNVAKLVWFEAHGRATSAIAREKKIAFIEAMNPRWKDLTEMLQRDSSPAEAGSE